MKKGDIFLLLIGYLLIASLLLFYPTTSKGELLIASIMIITAMVAMADVIYSSHYNKDALLLELVKREMDMRDQLTKVRSKKKKEERRLNYFEAFGFCVIKKKVDEADAKDLFEDMVPPLKGLLKRHKGYKYVPKLVKRWEKSRN